MRADFLNLDARSPVSLGAGNLTFGEVDMTGPSFRIPTGISFWGGLFGEGTILNLEMALERKLNIAHSRPTLPS
jgi:hypothetical protein